MAHYDIKQVAAAALDSIDAVLSQWVPNGTYQGAEYVALNPTRPDETKGSFSINRKSGAWSEFADGSGGGDLVSLVAYLERENNGKACQRLAEFLGMRELPVSTPTQAPPATKKSAKVKWSVVLPVPAEAVAACPVRHYKNGDPSVVWTYFGVQGELLMKVMRFDISKQGVRSKDYRPLTYCVAGDGSGKHQWRWQQPADNRPLYGLDRLAANDGAQVVLTEGEKAADAAIELFPDCVSMTWAGGSKALSKADFSPLAGREVLLWPDNDEAGQACMQKLAAILAGMGCKVRLLAVAVLGGDWPQKADAADAAPHNITAEALAQFEREGVLAIAYVANTSIETSQVVSLGSPPISTGGDDKTAKSSFVVSDKGVFFRSTNDDGEEVLIRVCNRLDVLALTRDQQGFNWGMLVRLTDPDGTVKDWNIPSEYLATEGGAEILRQLFSMGLRAESGQQPRRRLIQYLQTEQPSKRYVLVNRLGWHGKAYMLPSGTLGTPREPLHFYSSTPDLNKTCQQGELDAWRENIAAYCINNPLLMFSVSSAFAAPLLHLIGMESLGLHFFGDSSQGKTTLLKVAASVCGTPDYVRTWRSTDNAMEGIATAHSDGLLILDELGQCDPRIVGDITYLLGNGKGKARANDRGGVRGNAMEWRLLFLSSGEHTLKQYMAEAGKKPKAGQEIRMLSIPADAGEQKGVFHDLHSFAGGKALSKFLIEQSAATYGTPFYVFLETLCSTNLEKLAGRIRRELVRFSDEMPAEITGQAGRAADKFALVGFAGELATSVGITGWPRGAAMAAAKHGFDTWVSERGGVGNLEDQQALAGIKLFFEMYGEARFTRWDRDDSTVDDHNVRTMSRCGFRKVMEDSNALNDVPCSEVSGSACSEIIYYVTPEAFKTELCKGFSIKRVKELLGECGALERDTEGGYTKSVRLPGAGRKKQRVYMVRPHLIPSMEDGIAEQQQAA